MSTTSNFPVLEAYAKLKREVSRIGAIELKAIDLGIKQMAILFHLIESPCTMSELAEYAQSDKASTTRTVESLVSSGYVKRLATDGDRRVRQVALTEKGRKKAKLAHEVREHIGARLEETLTAEERKLLARLLNKVTTGLQQKRME